MRFEVCFIWVMIGSREEVLIYSYSKNTYRKKIFEAVEDDGVIVSLGVDVDVDASLEMEKILYLTEQKHRSHL